MSSGGHTRETLTAERLAAIKDELADVIPEGEAIVFSREGYSVEQIAVLRSRLVIAEEALREIVRREARSEYASIFAAPGEFAQIAHAALDRIGDGDELPARVLRRAIHAHEGKFVVTDVVEQAEVVREALNGWRKWMRFAEERRVAQPLWGALLAEKALADTDAAFPVLDALLARLSELERENERLANEEPADSFAAYSLAYTNARERARRLISKRATLGGTEEA